MPDFEELLRFWFGDDESNPFANKKLWWAKDSAVDTDTRERFGALITQAREGGLEDWKKTPRGTLAFIILLDQLPRSAFRGTPEAFAADALALDAALRGMSTGADYRLRLIERCFFYLPLMHAEDAARQEQSVQKFGVLAEAAPPEQKAYFEETLDFAKRHRDIIAEFGRFPHRNPALGRPSSPVEIESLKRPGSSF